jgi:hypothetical protein
MSLVRQIQGRCRGLVMSNKAVVEDPEEVEMVEREIDQRK